MTRLKIGIVIFLLLKVCNSQAQEQKDAALRLAVSVEKKINNRFSVLFMHRTTLNQNISEIGSTLFDFGLSYDLNSYLSVSGNYRFQNSRNLENFYQPAHRFYANIALAKEWNDFSIQFRTRIQNQLYDWDRKDPYRNSKHILRNKITMRYRINSRYSSYTFGEQFFRFDNLNEVQTYRLGLGLTRKFNLKHKIDLYYMYQWEVNAKAPLQDFIFGINYNFRF